MAYSFSPSGVISSCALTCSVFIRNGVWPSVVACENNRRGRISLGAVALTELLLGRDNQRPTMTVRIGKTKTRASHFRGQEVGDARAADSVRVDFRASS